MIEREIAKKQLARLSRFMGFPRTEAAAMDMLLAIEGADTPEIAEQAITDFIDGARSDSRCPLPVDIRGWINEKQEPTKKRFHCRLCDNNGFRVRWILVTYRGGTLIPERSEVLSGITSQENANELQRQIEEGRKANVTARRQAVLSEAYPCSCHRASMSDHARTKGDAA